MQGLSVGEGSGEGVATQEKNDVPIKMAHKKDWEKESIHRPAPVQNFSLQKKIGIHRGKISVVDMVPGFSRVFVSTTGLESFPLGPEKFSKRFSFGGGCVLFFLL